MSSPSRSRDSTFLTVDGQHSTPDYITFGGELHKILLAGLIWALTSFVSASY